MSAIVTFNGTQYSLTAIRSRVSAQVPIKKEEAVFDYSPILSIEGNSDQDTKTIIVHQHGGKYYFFQGQELARAKFEKSETITAMLISKVALKSCSLEYLKALKASQEAPEPPRFQRDSRDRDYGSRDRHSTGSYDRKPSYSKPKTYQSR